MRLSSWIQRAALLAPLAVAPGCVEINDKVNPSPLETPRIDGRSDLRFGATGQPQMKGNPLDLPTAREPRRFGVTVVDVTPLPEAFRPRHASKGGVLVSSLLDTSPLALAGLEPMDLLVSIEGNAVATPAQVLSALEQAPDDQVLHLVIRKPEVTLEALAKPLGPVLHEETLAIEAVPHGPLDDSTSVSLIAFWTCATNHGSGWSLAPLVQVLARREYTRAKFDSGAATVRREVEWGFPLGLVHYERTEVARRGRPVSEESETKILWFIPVYSHSQNEADKS